MAGPPGIQSVPDSSQCQIPVSARFKTGAVLNGPIRAAPGVSPGVPLRDLSWRESATILSETLTLGNGDQRPSV